MMQRQGLGINSRPAHGTMNPHKTKRRHTMTFNTMDEILHRVFLETSHAQQKADFEFLTYYLWYLPSSTMRDGDLLAAKEQPVDGNTGEAYLPVTGERIPSDMDAEAYTQELYNKCILQRLPLLSIAEEIARKKEWDRAWDKDPFTSPAYFNGRV
jgi:hypothetical protein